jgi:hypothetical protein
MRLHVLGVPSAPANKNYNIQAFSTKVINACKMFKQQGMHVIYYGTELCQVECDEFVPVISKEMLEEEFAKVYSGKDWKTQGMEQFTQEMENTFNQKAISEIRLRQKSKDFIITFWGYPQLKVLEEFPDLIGVEAAIGYAHSSGRHKIYESYALKHGLEGQIKIAEASHNFYDTVIPSPVDLNDFEFSAEKDDYFLMCGRLLWAKGVDIAIQTTEEIGAKLILAGTLHGAQPNFPDHVQFVGPVNVEQRKKLMSKAKGLFCPTLYSEPYGYVAVESMASGTPVIAVDTGAFTETVLHGITGYRCRTFEQFCWAAKNIDKISPYDCRSWAEKNYSLEKIGHMYKDYLESLYLLYTKEGWYSKNLERHDLNFLVKHFPR